MNLPLFLDIAIGLIFIYLILSLLAAEIQELLATILQWRAKHLKEAIENLLVGDNRKEPSEISKAKNLLNQLYTNPLIENVNQEATGFILSFVRQPMWQLGKKYHLITSKDKETIFGDGKHSGPSYIPSETFATTLLEVLKIPNLTHKFGEIKLSKFRDELLTRIKLYLCGLDIAEVREALEQEIPPSHEPAVKIVNDFDEFKNKLNQVCKDFEEQKSTLEISIQRIQQRVGEYSITAKNWILDDKYKNKFKEEMKSFIKDIFDDNERQLLIAEMKLSLCEIAKVFDKRTQEHQTILAEIKNIDAEAYEQIKSLIDNLPKSVKESISTLAHRAQSKVDTVDKDINQLRKEIELWFDRSMDRATGVYKRNAKGVAIVIGLVIATVANADSFYMVSKLSTDKDLRNAIAQNAQVVNTSCVNPTPTLTSTSTQESSSITTPISATPINNLDCVRAQTKAVLEEVSFPIGWSSNTLTEQLSLPDPLITNNKKAQKWDFFGWNANTIVKKFYPQYQGNLKPPKSNIDWFFWLLIHALLPIMLFGLLIYLGIKIIWKAQKLTTSTYIWFALLSFLTTCLIIFTGAKVILGVFMGWALSAIAISMGAPFWFDLLGKVINVRNTGPKPASTSDNQATSQDQKASTRSGT